MKKTYKSSILNFFDHDDNACPICSFLKGDKTVDTLLYVIEVLDTRLAQEQKFVKDLKMANYEYKMKYNEKNRK